MTKHRTFSFAALLCTLALVVLGAFSASAATVNGRAFRDLNSNSIQDGADTGVPNVWVLVETPAGVLVGGMQTGTDGRFSITVPAGTYRVKFANPGGGAIQVTGNVGSNDAIDSDADLFGYSQTFTVTANQTVTYDVGYIISGGGGNPPTGGTSGGGNTNATCNTPIFWTVTNIVCNNGGTPFNAADDTYTFSITATGGTGTWGWDSPAYSVLMQPYGTARSFGPYLVSAGSKTVEIFDHDNQTCRETIVVTAPNCFTPPTGVLTMTCAPNATFYTDAGKTTWMAMFPAPTATSTCPVGTVAVTQTGGPAAGSKLAPGMYTITWTATDGCNNTRTCSSKFTVVAPCDEKVCGGINIDLLGITSDANHHKTYCVRVTNNNAAELQYVILGLPDGIIAESPATNTMYTAPSGRQYLVRNPNYSHFYSIRFKTKDGQVGIRNGQSDIFCYTLQPQTNPWYIHALVRTAPKTFCDVYLQTADCMPMQSGNNPVNSLEEEIALLDDSAEMAAIEKGGATATNGTFSAFPNPANNVLGVNLTKWAGIPVQLQMFDAQGRIVRDVNTDGSDDGLQLPIESLPAGVYQLRAKAENQVPETLSVFVKH